MVELESEGELTRSEVALFLREFADELDDDTERNRAHVAESRERGVMQEREEEIREEPERREDTDERRDKRREGHEETVSDDDSLNAKRLTFIIGGDSATVTVPETVEFDVDVESRSPMLSSSVSQQIELELSWELENPDEGASGDWIKIE